MSNNLIINQKHNTMKRFYKFLMPLVAIVAMALPWDVQAQTLTVANGTATNTYVPIYGYYCDADQHNQVVYPASMLADMDGSYITSLTFYNQEAASSAWGTTVTVKMMEITDSVLTDLVATTGATTVWQGTVNGTGTTETFLLTTPFEYQGGNLLLDITTTASSYSRNYWYGIARTGHPLMISLGIIYFTFIRDDLLILQYDLKCRSTAVKRLKRKFRDPLCCL